MKIKQKILIGAVASIAAVMALSIGALAYGPERSTFTAENPADYPTFNSITNNPSLGDERNFVRIREAGVGNYVDKIQLQPGKEYEVYTYVHNNAKDSLNESGKGIALDVRLKAQVPATLKAGEESAVVSTISALNSNPKSVWDEAYISSSSAVALRYVPSSAKFHSNGKANGSTLATSMFTNGTFLGYNSLDGIMPGCTQYSAYVIYKIKVDQPNFEMSKTVSAANKNTFVKSMKSQAGAEVDYKVTYKNTGTVVQNNVVLKDTLPKGVALIAGSGNLVNNANPNGLKVSDNMFAAAGMNIGNYSPGVGAAVTYRVKIGVAKDLVCGTNKLNNVASANTDNGKKEDNAVVEVEVDCKPTECKPGIPTGSKECEDWCEVPGKENLKPNDPDCTEGEPALPTELPKTGPMESALMIIAMTAIVGGVAYWYRSHEELKQATEGASKKPGKDNADSKTEDK